MDPLPPGLILVSAMVTGGTYDPTTGVWAIPPALGAAPGNEETLTIVADVAGAGTMTNFAEVVASGWPDPDSRVNNGEADEDDLDAATVTTPTVETENTIRGKGGSTTSTWI